MSFAIFDESFYLSSYPDVKAGVDAGIFSSGLQHFQSFGLAEGRVLVSPFYDEKLYLRKYPDVAAAVNARAFSSGLQHYIQSGEAEGRSAGSFNESAYLLVYPDVATAVAAEAFSSGLQHYVRSGQFEENRTGFFLGTSGNDTITGLGEGNKLIAGVSFNALSNGSTVAGVGEVDILIGGAGTNAFTLGHPSLPRLTSTSQQFYVGGGNTDYALIQNFERFSDVIVLEGASQNYNLQAVNGSLNISTASGDLVGIVEGVTSLLPLSGDSVDIKNFNIPIGVTGPFFVLV